MHIDVAFGTLLTFFSRRCAMKFQIEGHLNLKVVEMSPEERKKLEKLLKLLSDPRLGCSEAKSMSKLLQRDVLEREYLENRSFSRSETLAKLSAWCDASGKHSRGRPFAQDISRLLFGKVVPRLIDKDNNRGKSNAVEILEGFFKEAPNISGEPSGLYDFADGNPIELVEEGRPPPIRQEEAEETRTEPPPTTVSLERDLRAFVAHNPGFVEKGLKRLNGGKEVCTDAGKIDVLCEDERGDLVVIELKKGRTGDRVVGQTLRYMGCLKQRENRDVRGIIILGEPDDHVTFAAAAVPNIKVKYYRVSFEVSDEPPARETTCSPSSDFEEGQMKSEDDEQEPEDPEEE
ncbi:endonuclease NucS domain-containing protein [Acidobacteriota bacterium]